MSRSLTPVFSVVGVVSAICAVVWLTIAKPWLSPEQILQLFHSDTATVFENMLMDPLILGGKKVVPLVISEVQRRDMPRRRYAIGFLGNGSHGEAVPILKKILEDETEKDYIRGDALIAIYQIDISLGKKEAGLYIARQDYLGEIARQVTKGTVIATARRTYLQALLGSD